MDERKHYARTYLSLAVALFFFGGLFVASPAKAIDLPSDAWIRGNVSDIDGPVSDSYVKVMMFTAGGVDINWTLTDASGDYEVGVPGGFEYMVLVANDSHYMAMQQTFVLAGETAWMDFMLEPIDPLVTDVTIKGFVTDSMGTPRSDGHVLGVVFDEMGGDMPIYANVSVPDGTGYFEINVIPSDGGGGAVAMDYEGYPLIENVTEWPLVSGETYWFNITLEMPSASDNALLYGQVTVSGSGAPLENVLVAVDIWNEMLGEGYSNYTFTNEDGHYEMNVSNGEARLMIMKGGYTSAMYELDIGEGASIQQDAVLTPTNCIVRGNITDGSTSDPLPSVTVFIWYGFDEFSYGTTNQTGSYELRCIDGEGLLMTVETDGYSRDYAELDLLPGEEVWQDFELWPVTAWIEGTVTDFFSPGDPIEDAWVYIDSMYYRTEDFTDVDGYYRLEVPQGIHEVTVEHWDYRPNTSAVEAFDGSGTTHDVELLPWVLPLDRKLQGWVNDSVSGTGIPNANVRIQLLDGTYSNETQSDFDGYYEMYIPAVKILYLVTAYQHYPAYGVLDPSVVLDPREDFLLDRDSYPPNITYSQTPVDDLTWFNPTVIDAEVEEPNLERLMLMQAMFFEMDGDWEVFLLIDMKSTSFNPLDPDSGLDYEMVGDNYVIHEVWDATVPFGGWLGDGVERYYLSAYEQWWGPEQMYVIWGFYSNSTVVDVPGTAYFDVDTGELLWFWLDTEGQVYPGDPTATFAPQSMVLRFDTAPWSEWPMMDWTTLGALVADDMVFSLSETVPSGQYRTVFAASDFGYQPELVITNLTVDNDPPVADAGLDISAPLDSNVSFDGSGSTDNVLIANYTWNFTDGDDDIELYGESPSYVFSSLGEYVVTLTVSDAAGHSDTDEVVVTIVDDIDPVADAGPDQIVAVDEEVSFDGTGSTDNVGITNYTWVFNDGTEDVTLPGATPVYTFEEYGAFVVTLTVEDAAGNDDTDTVTIRVNAPPVADAGPDVTVTVGETVTFDGSDSSDDSGLIGSYVWTFEYDGEEEELTGESPTFTFDIAGEYEVTLEVTDSAGLTDTDTMTVTVEEDGAAGDESFFEEYWWALAIIAIIVVVAAASAAMLKSGKGKDGARVPDSDAEAPEEDIPPPPDD